MTPIQFFGSILFIALAVMILCGVAGAAAEYIANRIMAYRKKKHGGEA